MSHLTDARDILFADPHDLASDVSALSLDEQIEAAEWQLEVAIANLNACVGDAALDRAAFDLKCAISRVNGLCEQREARDREIQRQQTDELDMQDTAIAEGVFSHG